MIKITAKKFIEKIQTQNDIVDMHDFEVDGKVVISGELVKCKGLSFYNCVFNGVLIITDCELEKNITLFKCIFHKNIEINSIKVGFFERNRFETLYSISFIECKIEKNLQIIKCILQRRLQIVNSQILMLLLQQMNTIEEGVNIESSTIHEWFDCNNLRLKGSLNISKCSINTKTRFQDTHASNISFVKNLFTKDLWVTGGKIKNGVTFNDGEFDDNINLEAVGAEKILTIIGGRFKKSISVSYRNTTNNLVGSFQEIFIQSANFENGLYIQDSDLLNPSRLNSIIIPFNAQLNGKISIDNLKVNFIKFSGTNFNANVSLNNIQPKQILFDRFFNYSDIQLTDFRADHDCESEFIVNSSFLGKFLLLNTSLASFNKVKIMNSHFSDIATSNVSWFEDNQLETGYLVYKMSYTKRLKLNFLMLFINLQRLDDNVIISTKKQEIYRQLKVAMEKHGNRIQSLKFKQLEMKYYGKLLQYTKSFWNLDRLILISNLTNNHGKHWFKPVLLAIFLTIPFYILMIASMSPDLALAPANSVQDIKSTYDILSDNLAIYIQLFNPARLLNRIIPKDSNLDLHTITYFFDILQRIVLSFLIFQTISAFRKYSKS